MAQSVERRIGSAEVTGPIPVSSSFEKRGNLESIRFPLFCVPEIFPVLCPVCGEKEGHLYFHKNKK